MKNYGEGKHVFIRKLIEEVPRMKQWLIDYGRKLGALKEEEISYICTYRIKKMIQ